MEDDILIYGTRAAHDEVVQVKNQKLEMLLTRARCMNLKLNKDKYKLLMELLPYIEHVITKDGVKPDPEKIKAILDMPALPRVMEFGGSLSM